MLEHGLAARPYDCSHCGLRFFFRAELDNHTLGHHAHALAQPRPGDEDDTAQASFYQHLASTLGSNGLDLHYYTVPGGALAADAAKSPRKSPGRSNGRDRDRDASSGRGSGASSSSPRPRCLICGKDLPSARALANHLRSSHGMQDNGGVALDGDMQVCLLCKEVLPDRDGLLVHLALQHPAPMPLDMALLGQAHALQQQQQQQSVKQEPSSVVKEELDDEEVTAAAPLAEDRVGTSTPRPAVAEASPPPTDSVSADKSGEGNSKGGQDEVASAKQASPAPSVDDVQDGHGEDEQEKGGKTNGDEAGEEKSGGVQSKAAQAES